MGSLSLERVHVVPLNDGELLVLPCPVPALCSNHVAMCIKEASDLHSRLEEHTPGRMIHLPGRISSIPERTLLPSGQVLMSVANALSLYPGKARGDEPQVFGYGRNSDSCDADVH